MKSKPAAILGLIIASLLAAMLMLCLRAGSDPRPLLLAAPSGFGAQGLDPERVALFCKEEFLVTYELRRSKTARAAQSSHAVAMIGTNSHYRDILGYPVLDGGFFTEAAQTAGYRHAVLNETAAFALFGGVAVSGGNFKLDGETWTVAGVIDDLDGSSANIYVPSGFIGGRPDSLMTLLDGNVTETYAKNALKTLGIRETNYDFINFASSAAAFWERFAVGWKAALCFALILLGRIAIAKTIKNIPLFREKLKVMYMREMIAKDGVGLLKMIAGVALPIAAAAAVLALGLQILGAFLNFGELAVPSAKAPVQDFSRMADSLRAYHTAGMVLFALCIAALILLFATIWHNMQIKNIDKEANV